jgi:hypothetical protein
MEVLIKTRHKQNILVAALAFGLIVTHWSGAACSAAPATSPAASLTADEAQTIAQEAYIYFYPLVLMDVSRKHFTNIEAGRMFARGPMNTFSHAFVSSDGGLGTSLREIPSREALT